MLLEFSSFISVRYVNYFQVKYNSYYYTTLCNYKEEFVFKSISSQYDIAVGYH